MESLRKVGVGGEEGSKASQARAHCTSCGDKGAVDGEDELKRESRGRNAQSEGRRVSGGTDRD